MTGFQREMAEIWGAVGADSECGVLKSVLMHRPGQELALVDGTNYAQHLFLAPVDARRLRQQWESLVEVYADNGVTVHLVEGQREDRPNAMFVRDLVFTATEGAVLARPGHPVRRGEERAVAATLAALGVPIARTVCGDGTFDGACAMMVRPDLVLVATSTRTNPDGAQQVADTLTAMGVDKVVRLDVPYDQIHLDGCMNVVDRNTVVFSPWQMPSLAVRALESHGVRMVPATVLDEVPGMGLNFVALRPGKVVMPAGHPESRKLLDRIGVEAIEVEVDEIARAGGEMHCLTGIVRREPLGLD